MDSLGKIYFMEAFSQLTEFLQGELKILYYLLENPDLDLSPSDLSIRLSISRPRISAAIRNLKKKDLIHSSEVLHDKRRVHISLTEEGKNHVLEKKKNMDDYFEKYTQLFSEKDLKELIRLIELTVQIMDKESNNGEKDE